MSISYVECICVPLSSVFTAVGRDEHYSRSELQVARHSDDVNNSVLRVRSDKLLSLCYAHINGQGQFEAVHGIVILSVQLRVTREADQLSKR